MTNNKPIEVLFLDDEGDLRSSMQGYAAEKNIFLKCFSSLQEGLEELDRNHNIRFVILDAKGFLRPDQVKGTENDSFALSASRELDKLSFTQNRYLPYCYFTGHSDLRATYEGVKDFIVFDKNDNGVRDKLFDHVWEVINNSEEGNFRRQYRELFEAVDLINHADATKGLITLLKYMQEDDYTSMNNNIKGIFSEVRSLQELIYKALNKRKKGVFPDRLFKSNGMIEFNPTRKHLSGNKDHSFKPTTTQYQNQFIDNVATAIYWGTGEYIHSDLQRDYIPSRFGIKALIYSVFELMIWFKQLYSKS